MQEGKISEKSGSICQICPNHWWDIIVMAPYYGHLAIDDWEWKSQVLLSKTKGFYTKNLEVRAKW
jgi:hypothetical protein